MESWALTSVAPRSRRSRSAGSRQFQSEVVTGFQDEGRNTPVDWARILIVAFILVAAIATNVTVNLRFKHLADHFPFIGAAVWVVILACAGWRRPQWSLVPEAFKGSVFLLALVTCASLMPVETLPPASWQSSLALGFLSAVFDNIPLTALALRQGGYD